MQNDLLVKFIKPVVSTSRVELSSDSNQPSVGTFRVDVRSPVTVKGDTVNFNPNVMEMGVGIEYTYRSKKYMAVKTAENVVEIYRVRS